MSLLVAAGVAALAHRDVIWVPPPIRNAEASLQKYDACLRLEATAIGGQAPLSASRAEAVAARAVSECRPQREEARQAVLFGRLSIEDLEKVETDLGKYLRPAAATQVQAPPAENDIVVIGRKVRKVKFSVKLDKAGNAVCRIRRSSGDAEIDALACDAGRACAHSTSQAAMIACITPRWKQIAAQVAERRRARSMR